MPNGHETYQISSSWSLVHFSASWSDNDNYSIDFFYVGQYFLSRETIFGKILSGKSFWGQTLSGETFFLYLYMLRKAHTCSIHSIFQTFPHCCLWNSNVGLADSGPILSFQGPSLSNLWIWTKSIKDLLKSWLNANVKNQDWTSTSDQFLCVSLCSIETLLLMPL